MQTEELIETEDEYDESEFAAYVAETAANKAKAEAVYNWMSQDELDLYFRDHPSDNPRTDRRLMEAVNRRDYVDRGLNGPLGGKGGTPSIDAQIEIRRLQAGEHGEMSLMTFTVDGKTMTMAELQAYQSEEN